MRDYDGVGEGDLFACPGLLALGRQEKISVLSGTLWRWLVRHYYGEQILVGYGRDRDRMVHVL